MDYLQKLLVAAVGVLIIFLCGFGVDRIYFFDPYKANVIAQGEIQKKLDDELHAKYQQDNKEAQHEADIRVAAVHAYYKRLYGNTTSSTTSTKTSETTSGSDVYSPNNLPPTSKLAEDCAVTTVKYLTLQEWAEKVSQ